MPGITVTQACKSYETSHYTVKAVNHANLSVESGEAVAIVGPSGSGKSTLLNIIGLILKPDSGSVAVDGKEVLNMSDRRCSAFRNASFGYIVQDFALLDDETVYHNIRIPLLYNRQIKRREHKPRIREIAQKLDISDKLNRKAGKLSGGERQRVAIARALVKINAEDKAALRAEGFMTRDPRSVERKKPGQPKARRRFQFSKR